MGIFYCYIEFYQRVTTPTVSLSFNISQLKYSQVLWFTSVVVIPWIFGYSGVENNIVFTSLKSTGFLSKLRVRIQQGDFHPPQPCLWSIFVPYQVPMTEAPIFLTPVDVVTGPIDLRLWNSTPKWNTLRKNLYQQAYEGIPFIVGQGVCSRGVL